LHLPKGYSMMGTIGEVSSMIGFVRDPQHKIGAAAFFLSKNQDRIRINGILSILESAAQVDYSSASRASFQILPSFIANPFFSSSGANRRIWLSLSPFFFARLCGVSGKRILAI